MWKIGWNETPGRKEGWTEWRRGGVRVVVVCVVVVCGGRHVMRMVDRI